ncbi:ALK and LTK ligand 2 isoform X1 [Perognathus longimembris pacificus]|uniref:ALK and LTK ligand 2 isoform X1 n=1 Tax=Perognathus longimembris pacificus TaxID=214514 RepID=UPI002019AE95|nr:ALK and LTK ligand 2 isoform X1 [Perognathus longimembris pacificus]
MRAPGRPLLLGLLLVLSSAGPGWGRAQPRGPAHRQTLLRLLVELVQELKKFHLGEAKKLQVLAEPDFALGRREAAEYGADAEEQRVEIVPRDLRMKDKFLKHLTGAYSLTSHPSLFLSSQSLHGHLLLCSRASLFQSEVQQTLPQTLPQHSRLHHPCM